MGGGRGSQISCDILWGNGLQQWEGDEGHKYLVTFCGRNSLEQYEGEGGHTYFVPFSMETV